jgi:hypothetical protein
MRCLPARVSTLSALCTFIALFTACSGSSPETVGAAGTGGENTPFGVQVAETDLTIENRTGTPVVGGEMEIVPLGILPPFKAQLPRLEPTAKRQIMFNTFHGSDGTPFDRRVANAKLVKITGKDRTGKEYAVQVPFK